MLKKFIAVFVGVVMCLLCFPAFGCGEETLKIYNCYDYILDEGKDSLLKEFEEYYKEKTGKKIKVVYSCFDTPEDAYNNLKINFLQQTNKYNETYHIAFIGTITCRFRHGTNRRQHIANRWK